MTLKRVMFANENFHEFSNIFLSSKACYWLGNSIFHAFNHTDQIFRAGEIYFKVGEAWNTEKYCRPPWLADNKNFRTLDALEWLKQ